MVRYRLRLSAKRTSYIHRHNSISAKEKRFLSNLKRYLLILLALYKKSKKLSSIESLRVSKIKKCFTMVLVKYHQVAYTPFEKNIRTKRSNINFRSRDIDSFSSSECWKLFRTRKEHLYQLKIAFKFVDRDFTADNSIIFKGEEILLIGLARYSTAAQLEHILGNVFMLDFSQLSRAFKLFNNHMLEHFSNLLTDNLAYWVPKFPLFARVISDKLYEKSGIRYAEGAFRVACFHDDTVIATCRPGSGPTIDGGRHCNFIQMAFYNGWKKHHGYKYQTVELPNGMCADMFGPRSFRHNDLELLRDSQLNERLRLAQIGNAQQFCSYGDGIFPIDTHTIGKHVGLNLSPQEKYENRMMSKIRISNEWDYGATANLFPFIKYKTGQRTRQNDLVTRYYFVATILRNAHMCLYEGLQVVITIAHVLLSSNTLRLMHN
jgi:hypothetical protein